MHNLRPVAIEGYPRPASLLQSAFWGRFKRNFGWEPRHFLFGDADYPLLALTRPIPLFGSLVYVPHGPEWKPGEGSVGAWLTALAEQMLSYLPSNTFCIRFDTTWEAEAGASLRRDGRLMPGIEIQPANTVIVDLARDEAELLSAMKPKTRYNIGLASRRGVTTRVAGSQEITRWYRLYRETAQRQRIAVHSIDYYHRLFAEAERGDAPRLLLLMAELDNEPIAGIVVALWGANAIYLYGASSNRNRNLMPSFALQWHAMRMARTEGCRIYDMFGIPPAEDRRHPLHGLYRFKTGFGGQIVRRAGAWDFPRGSLRNRCWHLSEGLRAHYFRRLRKRS